MQIVIVEANGTFTSYWALMGETERWVQAS
jgi:hypothetical protein